MNRLLGYFWRGCLVLVPVAVTAYSAYLVVSVFDQLVPLGIPGLGFLVVLVVVTLVGFMTSNVIGSAVVDAVEGWLTSVPLLKLVYGSIRDLVEAFVGEGRKFDRPVAVRLEPGGECYLLGFVTRDTLSQLGMVNHVAVYVPQSYNFAGNLLIVPRDQVKPLRATSSDLMAFVVSGGISGLGIDAGARRRARRKPLWARTVLGLGPGKGHE